MGRDRGPGGGRGGRRRDRDNDNPRREENARSAESNTPAPAASTANSFGTVSEAERIRTRASEMIKLHDKSGNGILEGDEVAELGMSRGADKDGDGVITRDDLIAFYTPKSPSSAAQSVPSSRSTADQTKSDEPIERKITNDKRKSYRFKSTKERASKWRFSSRDANGDGQVSMSEYSRSWTDRTAAEFIRYDKNNDGMITADEVK